MYRYPLPRLPSNPRAWSCACVRYWLACVNCMWSVHSTIPECIQIRFTIGIADPHAHPSTTPSSHIQYLRHRLSLLTSEFCLRTMYLQYGTELHSTEPRVFTILLSSNYESEVELEESMTVTVYVRGDTARPRLEYPSRPHTRSHTSQEPGRNSEGLRGGFHDSQRAHTHTVQPATARA